MLRNVLFSLAIGLIVVGCSTATSERLKHFFFEIPAGEVRTVGAEGQSHPDGTPADRPRAPAAPTRFASIHEPFRSRDCIACHDDTKQMQLFGDFETTCKDCHDRYFSDEVGHAPVFGDCMECHDPHRSSFPSLLKRSIPDTCAECHGKPDELSQPAHAGNDAGNCTKCHDAHFGDPPLLKPGVAVPDAGDS
jgi:predicted CXXCH cytochrome family protein